MGHISFRSMNFPDRFVRHKNFLGELTPVVSQPDRQDATFAMVPGLADNTLISFESINFPNHFLKHQDFRLKLAQRPPGDGQFNADATFFLRPGLADATASSFASVNFPARFIRHRDFHLFLEVPNNPPDATFKLVPGFIDSDMATFDAGPLTSDLPLGGSCHLVVRKNGDFTFSGHAHDSGFDNIDYVLSAVVMTPSGIAFTFQHAGHVEGTVAGLPFGTPNRNDDFTVAGNNPSITNEWDSIPAARMVAKIGGKDTLVGGLQDVLKKAAEELGKAAATHVIAIVL